jgi:hypothetical protein
MPHNHPPKEYARQQFHNIDHFDAKDYVRPEWYEMPQVAHHFSHGGAVVQRAMDLIQRHKK